MDPNELWQFAQEMNGVDLQTVGGRALFRVDVDGLKLLIRPLSTEGIRPISGHEFDAFCVGFNEIGTMETPDYNKVTFHASYLLGLVRAFREAHPEGQ